MDPNQTDVQPDPSTGGAVDPTPSTAGTVTPDPGLDRPVRNIQAEFNRKYGQLEQKVDAIVNWLAAAQQPQAARQTATPNELSDADLFKAAQQGDQQAFELWTDRRADRRVAQTLGALQGNSLVERQLQAIYARYPELNDGSHPLTQRCNMAYALLTNQGYPATRSTMLEAAKTAIADSPDIVAEIHLARSQGGSVRQSAANRAQAGVTGVTHRVTPAQANTSVKISPQEAALARRMGIKNPGESKARFLKRQEEGQSSLGAVSAFVREEDL